MKFSEERRILNEELAHVSGGWTYWMPNERKDGGSKWPYCKEGADGNSWGPHWGE